MKEPNRDSIALSRFITLVKFSICNCTKNLLYRGPNMN